MNAGGKVAAKRVYVFAAAYLVAYLVASYLDLGSTSLGLQRPGVSERMSSRPMPRVATEPAQAWLLTLAGAVIMLACIRFSANHAGAVEGRWLRQPIRSYGVAYLNPWSKRGPGVSPLHTLSLVLAFVLLRVAAAANNLSVYASGWGPMGEAIKWASAKTFPLAGFCMIAFSCFMAAVLVMSPIAARIITSWKRGG